MILETVVAILKAEPTVSALVSDRIYPVTLPDAPDLPAIVVSKATGFGEYDLAGDVGLEDARVQIDLFGKAGQAAITDLRNAVRRFLSGYRSGPGSGGSSGTCVIQCCMCINDFDLVETAAERGGPRIRRRVLEFRIWNTEV